MRLSSGLRIKAHRGAARLAPTSRMSHSRHFWFVRRTPARPLTAAE
jgi:hypothetical protein